MAKYCPILDRKVVYLDCLECDDKQCENSKQKQENKEEGETNHADLRSLHLGNQGN